ncbi:MAG: hypothetical protein RBT57_12660 [Paludibacter sp.]|nr:hypothetical protein [Paludibacter sp.]
MNKILILPVLMLLLGTPAIKAQDSSPKKIGLAIGGSASTNGLGVSVIAALNRSIAVRVGYESLTQSFAEPFVYGIEDIDFNITPNIKVGGITANVDFYLLKGLYLTGGVVQTNFDLGVNLIPKDPMMIGEIEYQPEDIGQLNVKILPERRLSPYAGLGFGRTISRDKKLAMNFELGAYHMGSYVIDMTGTGLLQGNSDNESVKRINTVLSGFSWSGLYPVVKLGLSFRIF